ALIGIFKQLGITETYGKLAIDEIGGGRPASGLPVVSKRRAANHIRNLHAQGITFNYLLNAVHCNGQEFTKTGRNEIYKLLRWLHDMEVDMVTVSMPYLLRLIKDKYPSLKVCVSTNAGVQSVGHAKFWERIGADEITLSHVFVNRNFVQLKLIREAVSCPIRLIANIACMSQCPLFNSHTIWDTYASQKSSCGRAGLFMCYYIIYCRYMRLINPSEFIRSPWIRPEDVSEYEKRGIDKIKLVDRKCSTENIANITTAYHNRRYKGNLIDLLPHLHGKSPLTLKNIFTKMRYIIHPYETPLSSEYEFIRLFHDMDVYIDNTKLNNFIKKFIDEDCSQKDCEDCKYCDGVADDVVVFDKDKIERAREKYKHFLDNFIQGRY
ncbi:MAG: U32 family peptidase, partial [Candidatus Omnitrophica bacterium]|nr:U32 family peptidase [Candidatus Omnitrophota bacterium]